VNYETQENKLLFYRNDQYPHLKLQGKLHYFYRRKYTTVHEIQLSYNHYEITQGLFDKNPDYLEGKTKIKYFELAYIHQYNNTNVRVYPSKGLEIKTTIMKRGLGIDKDVNRFEIINQTSFFQPIWNNISASFIFRGRYSSPQQQPYLFNRALGFKNDFIAHSVRSELQEPTSVQLHLVKYWFLKRLKKKIYLCGYFFIKNKRNNLP
jgi:hypothetical protein